MNHTLVHTEEDWGVQEILKDDAEALDQPRVRGGARPDACYVHPCSILSSPANAHTILGVSRAVGGAGIPTLRSAL